MKIFFAAAATVIVVVDVIDGCDGVIGAEVGVGEVSLGSNPLSADDKLDIFMIDNVELQY